MRELLNELNARSLNARDMAEMVKGNDVELQCFELGKAEAFELARDLLMKSLVES